MNNLMVPKEASFRIEKPFLRANANQYMVFMDIVRISLRSPPKNLIVQSLEIILVYFPFYTIRKKGY